MYPPLGQNFSDPNLANLSALRTMPPTGIPARPIGFPLQPGGPPSIWGGNPPERLPIGPYPVPPIQPVGPEPVGPARPVGVNPYPVQMPPVGTPAQPIDPRLGDQGNDPGMSPQPVGPAPYQPIGGQMQPLPGGIDGGLQNLLAMRAMMQRQGQEAY